MGSNDGCTVGAIASDTGGVGKTVVLLALAHHRDVIDHFTGGIYFMSLGSDATVGKVIEQLCDTLKGSGGKYASTEARLETNTEDRLEAVISVVRKWFGQRVCLFIFDDLWRSKDIKHIKPNILIKLSTLITEICNGRESRLLYSTRNKSWKAQGQTVLFKRRESRGPIARKIIFEVSGARNGQFNDPVCRRSVLQILDRCAGLPVVLCMVGKAVGNMRDIWDGGAKEVWNNYLLQVNDIFQGETYNYTSLRLSLLVSLNFLNTIAASSGKDQLPLRKMHRALCVLQKQQWVSVHVLKSLWDPSGANIAGKVVKYMTTVRIADAEYREQGGFRVLGLRLHDLVHDFAHLEASKHEGASHGYAILVNSYLEEVGGEGNDTWPGVREADDGYNMENVCRLLLGYGRIQDVVSVLLSAQWIVKMMDKKVLLQLSEDVNIFIAAMKRKMQKPGALMSDLERDKVATLKFLTEVTRLGLSYCDGNLYGAWLQLYAILQAKKGF